MARWLTWEPISLDESILELAWEIEAAHSISFWDALIVSSATAMGCHTLLSEDLQHLGRYGEVRVVNPFRQRPEGLTI